jgi:hypothetical protein
MEEVVAALVDDLMEVEAEAEAEAEVEDDEGHARQLLQEEVAAVEAEVGVVEVEVRASGDVAI